MEETSNEPNDAWQTYLKQAIAQEPLEYAFYLIVRRLRELLTPGVTTLNVLRASPHLLDANEQQQLIWWALEKNQEMLVFLDEQGMGIFHPRLIRASPSVAEQQTDVKDVQGTSDATDVSK